jgi:hypothetical protein
MQYGYCPILLACGFSEGGGRLKKASLSKIYIFVILLSSIAIQIPLHNRSLLFFDEGVIFNAAEFVLEGGVLYKGKIVGIVPGIFYLLALLYKIFGVSFLVSRYAIAVVFSFTALLVFFISRHLMDERIAFAAALVFVAHRVWAFPVWNYMGYAPIAIFFLALALCFIFSFAENPRSGTAFIIGLLVATVTLFKQDYGAFSAMGLFLYIFLWPSLRPESLSVHDAGFSRIKVITAYVSGGIAMGVLVFIFFALKGAHGDLLQNTLVIPLTRETTRETTSLIPMLPLLQKDHFVRDNWFQYAPSITYTRLLLNWQNHTPPSFLYGRTPVWDILLKLIHYLPYLASLAVAGILAIRYIKRDNSVEHQKTVAVLTIGVMILMTQHKPFDFAHLIQMYLPVFVLVAFSIDTLFKALCSRKAPRYAISGLLSILLVVYLFHTIAGAAFIVKHYSARLEGSRASIYLTQGDRDSLAEAVEFISENTSPNDPIFVLPYHSLFYFLSDRPIPSRYEVLWPVKVFDDMDREIIGDVEEKNVEYIIEFPQEHEGIGSYRKFAPDFIRYMENNYSTENTIGDQEKELRIVILKKKTE